MARKRRNVNLSSQGGLASLRERNRMAQAKIQIAADEEFKLWYDTAMTKAQEAEQDPTPERYAALLDHYGEWAEVLERTPANLRGNKEKQQRITDANNQLVKRISDRLTALRELPERTPAEEEELEGWRKLWRQMNSDANVPEMLAAEGLELHHGTDEDGEETVWVEPEGGAVDDTDPYYPWNGVQPPGPGLGKNDPPEVNRKKLQEWITKYGRLWHDGAQIVIPAGLSKNGEHTFYVIWNTGEWEVPDLDEQLRNINMSREEHARRQLEMVVSAKELKESDAGPGSIPGLEGAFGVATWEQLQGATGAVDDTDPLYKAAKRHGYELTNDQLAALKAGNTLEQVLSPEAAERIRATSIAAGADVEGFQERFGRLEKISELVDRDPENTKHFLTELDDFAHWLATEGRLDPEAAAPILRPFRAKAMEISPYEAAVELLPPRDDHVRKTGWHEVVDIQDEMIRFWASPFGREYGRAWGNSMAQSSAENNAQHPTPGWDPSKMGWASQLARIEQAKFQMADPVYINEEVQDLIAATIGTWPATPLRREDVFPSFYGFAMFPRPFVIKDTLGKDIAIRAFAWELLGPHSEIMFEAGATQIDPTQSTGVFITAYAHRDDPDDYPIMQNLEEASKSGQLRIPISVLPVMSLSYATPWHFEQTYYDGQEENNPLPIDLTGSGLEKFCAIVRVTWALAQEKITSAPLERLPRPERRRAERTGLIPDVVVIRLRHTTAKKKDGEQSSIEYSHRWMVRPHWRQQWYPSEQRHKPKLIGSYIKGPLDKEFKAKPLRAYEFIR